MTKKDLTKLMTCSSKNSQFTNEYVKLLPNPAKSADGTNIMPNTGENNRILQYSKCFPYYSKEDKRQTAIPFSKAYKAL